MNDKDSKNLKGTRLVSLEELEASINEDSRYIDRVKIGKGGQATVYKVFDKKLKVNRAMKILNPEFSEDVDFIEDFIREIRLTAELNSPNIVKVYDADFIDNDLFMIMDFIEGNTAGNYGKLPVPIGVAIAIRASQALEYAHSREVEVSGYRQRGIIHRDIKPDNLMIGKDGEVKVMDFGLSKTMERKGASTTSNIQGSIMYMAPEQFDKKISAKSDIYSLGVTLHELITGKTGFEGMSTAQIFKEKSSGDYYSLIDREMIDKELEKIIRKATERNPAKRYGNISEMTQELDNYLNRHYTVDNDLTRVVGAFINFKILPAEKESYKPKKGKVKSRKSSSGGSGNGLKVGIFVVLALIIVALGVVFFDDIAGIFKGDKEGVIVEEEVEQEPVQAVSEEYKLIIKNKDNLKAKVYFGGQVYDMNKKTFEIPVAKKGIYIVDIKSDGVDDFRLEANIDQSSNLEVYDPPEYTIVFDYPSYAKGFNVKVNDLHLGSLKNLKKKSYITRKSGSYRVRISDDSEKYVEIDTRVNLGGENEVVAFSVYPPLNEKYKITINNPDNLQGTITVGSITEIFKGIYQKSYTSSEKKTYTIKSDGFKDKSFTADFSRKDEWVFDYKPEKIKEVIPEPVETPVVRQEEKPVEIVEQEPEQEPVSEPEPEPVVVKEKYKVEISNINKLNAQVSIDGKDFKALGNSFIDSSDEKKVISYLISTEGYRDTVFTVDFSQKKEFNLIYDPVALPMTIVIENSPAGGTVKIDGISFGSTAEGETRLEGITFALGSQHDIEIEASGYLKWGTRFEMSSREARVRFEGQKPKARIVITPQLDEGLSRQTSLFIDGVKQPFRQILEDLEFGSHTIDIVFKIGQYQDKLTETFTFSANKKSAEWALDIDIVKISSTAPETKISVSGTPVGYADLTLPFINKNLVTITAENDEYDIKEESISPKAYSGKTYQFRFPVSKKAEESYFAAEEFLDEYEESNNSTMLLQAKLKLDEALQLYKGYPEALQLYFKLMAIQSKLGHDTEDKKKLDKYYETARNLYEENKDIFPEESVHGWSLGYFLTCNYYKALMINDTNARKYHLQEVIDNYHDDYSRLRKSIKTNGIHEILERDRLDCNWARICHDLWKILNDENANDNEIKKARNRARKAWGSNPYNDIVDPHNPGAPIDNPYKQIRNQHYQELMSY